MNFTDTLFIKNYLKPLGISNLTEIQKLCIEPIFQGNSVFGLAPTGSGKTLAFVLPLLLKIGVASRNTQLLILTPTRELGLQIAKVANQVAKLVLQNEGKNILIRTAFGGTPIAGQIEEIIKKPHVIIATPGRLIDLLDREVLSLKTIKSLVLDEADILVNMGFSDQVEAIVEYLQSGIQVAMFSATKSSEVSELENLLLKDCKYISASVQNDDLINNQNQLQSLIQHFYVKTEDKKSKEKLLKEIISKVINSNNNKCLIFCHTRENVHQLASSLKKDGFNVDALSGELGQVYRNSILRNFKTGSLNILVATNIAARGIDVSNLPYVIHFDLPYTIEDYIHRSGRTGRAGNNGAVVSFCENKSFKFYENLMKEAKIDYSEFKQFKKEPTSQTISAKNTTHYLKVFINKGKKDKIRPGDIVGALINEFSLLKGDIGNIYIFDRFSHVEVNQEYKNILLNKNIKIKNLIVKIKESN